MVSDPIWRLTRPKNYDSLRVVKKVLDEWRPERQRGEFATVSSGDPQLDFAYFIAEPQAAASTLTHSGTTDGDILTRVAHEGRRRSTPTWRLAHQAGDWGVDEPTDGQLATRWKEGSNR